MSWIAIAASLIRTAFPSRHASSVDTPAGLEGARVAYVNRGREGSVIFRCRRGSFEMYFGFGGGEVVAVLDVPTVDEWRSRTGLPLELRDRTLDFIGRQVAKDQTSGGRGRHVVEPDSILICV